MNNKVIVHTVILSFYRILFICFFIFWSQLYAQTTNETVMQDRFGIIENIDNQKLNYEFNSLNISSLNLTEFELNTISEDKLIKDILASFSFKESNINLFTEFSGGNRFSIAQKKIETINLSLGGYELYNTNFNFIRKNKYFFQVGLALVKQSSFLNYLNPNLRYSVNSLLEYKIDENFSFYLYGQYLTNPINSVSNSIDPILYMSPLFMQTETGGGVKAQFKNFKADVGMKSLHDIEFNQQKSLNLMNAKFSFGF